MAHTPESKLPDGWLQRVEAATYARVSLATIDRAVASGELRSVKRGRRRLIHEDWVTEWLMDGAAA